MAVQAQESSRPASTDRHTADNTTVMLKGVSVQYRKKSDNRNSLWLLLGVREVSHWSCVSHTRIRALSGHRLSCASSLDRCMGSNLNGGKAVSWWMIFPWNISTTWLTQRCLLSSCHLQVNASLRSGLKKPSVLCTNWNIYLKEITRHEIDEVKDWKPNRSMFWVQSLGI